MLDVKTFKAPQEVKQGDLYYSPVKDIIRARKDIKKSAALPKVGTYYEMYVNAEVVPLLQRDPLPTPLPEPTPVPVPEKQPEPKPVPVQELPKPAPLPVPTGERKYGNIMPLIRGFHKSSGKQDFSGLFDGNFQKNWWVTDYDNKTRNKDLTLTLEIPAIFNAEIDKFVLGDFEGSSTDATRFHGIYLDESGKQFKSPDIIPPFTGNAYNVQHTYPFKQAGVLAAIEIEPKMGANDWPVSAMPSELEIWAHYDDVREQEPERPTPPVISNLGVVTYPYDLDTDAWGKFNPPAVFRSVKTTRIYLDMGWVLKGDKFCFNPFHQGSWRLDEILRHNTGKGIHTILCIRGNERLPIYVEYARQVAIRYGRNKNVPAELIKQDNSRSASTENVVGLAVNCSIQISNELNGGWRQDFMDAHQLADLHVACYKAIKEIAPEMQVVSCGLAHTDPGYMEAFFQRCRLNHGGLIPIDAIAYHDYPNDSKLGEQRQGGTGTAVELSKFYQTGKAFIAMARRNSPNKKLRIGITEIGYSISTLNPEQAATAMGDRDIFHVAADLNLRVWLEVCRLGFDFNCFYQMFHDMAFKEWGPQGIATNWDTSNGIAGPQTDYMYQILQYLDGSYLMSREADRTKPVFVDKFESSTGKPRIYSFVVPTYEDKKVADYEIDLEGAKDATLIEFVSGSEMAKETKLTPVNGKVKVFASESVRMIRVNN